MHQIFALLISFITAAFATTTSFNKCILVGDTFGCSNATEGDLPKTIQPLITRMIIPEESKQPTIITTKPVITRIIISKSKIRIIKKELLTNFPVLVDFESTGNEIETIEDDAFENMALLKYVDLSNNTLKRINPNLFQNCSNIHWFNVSDNADLTIPDNEPFLNAPHLEVLDLQRCNIKKLFSVTFKNLPGLKFLSLSGNKITSIPNDVFKPLSYLNILDLSDNKMKSISLQVFAEIRPMFLYLVGNPWECDCKLYPMIQWYESFLLKEEVVCVKPSGKKWEDVKLNDCPKSAITEVWNNFYKGI